jgi:AcrR family transcriptional regulator
VHDEAFLFGYSKLYPIRKVPPIPPTSRPYSSPGRSAQADATRSKILDAARLIFKKRGYEDATISAVATQAGVAAQTVYAVFGSKRGILAVLLDQARFGPAYSDLVRQALETDDAVGRLRFAARIARQIHDAERSELNVFRGAAAVSPELAQIEAANEIQRRDNQASVVTYLAQSGSLRTDIDEEAARDMLWALTGRDCYRMLVGMRSWSSAQYESWLTDTLIRTLLPPSSWGEDTHVSETLNIKRKKVRRGK